MRTNRYALSLAAIALLVGACGRLSGAGGSGGTGGPSGADQLVIRVEIGGGFIGPNVFLRQPPSFSLYADGRIITEGPQIEIYPGPALPNLLVTPITKDGIQAILDAARDAGLFAPDHHFDCGGIADAPTTTFTLDAEGQRHVISAYALAEGEQCPGVSAADQQARQRLAEFQRKLSGLSEWLPQGSLGDEKPYDFSELRIFTSASQPSDLGPQQPVDWPLSQPLASFGEPVKDLQDYRCGTVEGDDLQALLPLAKSANELTVWHSDGTSYQLLFRPLLPDERGC